MAEYKPHVVIDETGEAIPVVAFERFSLTMRDAADNLVEGFVKMSGRVEELDKAFRKLRDPLEIHRAERRTKQTRLCPDCEGVGAIVRETEFGNAHCTWLERNECRRCRGTGNVPRYPLARLVLVEALIGKPELPDVEPPEFVPLELSE